MYIGLDFDGTVVDHRYPEIGAPVEGAIDWLKRFHELGAQLILHTVRSDSDGQSDGPLTQAVNYLTEQGVVLSGVNSNPTQSHWSTSPKVFAEIYIDDAAFGCPLVHPEGFARRCVDWSIVGSGVESLLKANRKPSGFMVPMRRPIKKQVAC